MAEEFQAAVCDGGWWNPPPAAISANFGGCWQIDMKAKSSDESSDCSMTFNDIQKPGGGTTTMSPDSAFQMMGIRRSPPTTTAYWDQSIFGAGARSEENYNQTLPEILNNFPATGEDSSGQLGFPMDQQNPLNFVANSGDCITSSLDTSYSYPSSLLQTLFDSNSPPPPPPPPLPSSSYDFEANFNDFNSTESLRKRQVHGGFHLANKAPFWDAPVSASNDQSSSFFRSTPAQYRSSEYKKKPDCPTITVKSHHEEMRSSVKKSCIEPTFKRTRLETPSPLPTFKVRKEKLGDRITALQQLVSPFGKTDTASVLHEAIEYIKLLHDQVNVLSTPYLENEATTQRQQVHDKRKDAEKVKVDLRSRGLCLVPLSSTFPVAAETVPEFWTPSFGGPFR